MSKVLVAVGGTGQEVALGCLRLCHMAGIEVPQVFVFDSDTFDPIAAPSQVPTRSQALRELGESIAKYRGSNPVEFMQTVDHEGPTDTIVSLFSPANQTPRAVADLFTLLLTPRQRATRVIDGFHGQPTVGAIAFADYVCSGGLEAFISGRKQNGKIVAEGLDQLMQRPDAKHFIVIVGGTAGGTGPGVIPVLARKIAEWREGLNPKREIGVSIVVQLPWFQLTRGNPQEDLDVAGMQRNSACLVRLYANELEQFADRVVFLGLPRMVRRASAGPNHQPETRHYVNILSGWLTAELLSPSQPMLDMSRPALYGLALDDGRDMTTELTLTLDRASAVPGPSSIPLRRAVDAIRLLVAFGEALRRQLNYPRELALPRETWRLIRRVGEGSLPMFTQELVSFVRTETDILRWFRASCDALAEGEIGRDAQDEQKLFKIPEDAVATDLPSVAKIRPGFKGLAHEFVADLIYRANLLDTVAGDVSPSTKAASLYSALRAGLARRLLA